MAALPELLGSSRDIATVRDQVGRLLRTWSSARRPPPVLIQGETGTGKGLLARALHHASPRAQGPFVDINCAAVPETLLEAELFGYERGAFTDAKQSKAGLFQLAHRGTLFLDEVGLLPPALQAKLLSVLEERAVRRLGATRAEPVDVWVIAATNEDLAQALRERRFRDDLYHRIAVVALSLPPLRARGEDIVLLAEHFLNRACTDYGLGAKTLSSGARKALVAYRWPGNIRELSNVIERAALLGDATTVDAAHLALIPDVGAPIDTSMPGVAEPEPRAAPSSSRDAIREHLERVLAQTGWNISRTAALLGVSRNTVMARIARFGLRGPRKAGSVPTPAAAPALARPPEAPSAHGTQSSGHWGRRRLTFVRVVLHRGRGPDGGAPASCAALIQARAESELEPSFTRYLDIAADKLRAFGARIEGAGVSAVLAVFGLDERDEPAVLAGHAALVVRNAARQGLGDDDAAAVRVGLHTAEVPVRASAGGPVLDADAAREAWNGVAAAMQLASPGTIVATDAATALLRRRFALAALGPDTQAHRIDGLGRTDATVGAARTLFVGRREELALVQSRLAAAVDGRGQVVNIVAEVGMGKSRLILELASAIRSGAARHLEGRCMPGEVQTPFAPLLQILRSLCGITEADDAPSIHAKAAAAITHAGIDDEDARRHLVHLLDATSAPTGPPAARTQIFTAVQRLLVGESARRPLLLVVEDLHWIDPSSEACLAALVDVIRDVPILLVTSSRPTYRPPWTSGGHALSLALTPLSDEESAAVIRGVMPVGLGSPATEAHITTRADGNPLFLEELSRSATETRDGVTAGPADIPATIDEAIGGRLARLGPRPRRVLSGLAVIGRDAPASLARAILDLSDDALQTAIEPLRRAEFLHETSVEGEPGFTFRHALVREVAYAHVPAAERKALHLRALDTMERLYSDRIADQVERLAHHAVLGDARERAVDYLLRAGEKAAARSALAEALAHVEQGLGIVPSLDEGPERDGRDFALECARARLLMATRGYAAPDTERAYARAREIGQRVGDAARLGPVLTGQWAHFLVRAEYDAALRVAEEMRAIAAPDDALMVATAHRALGMTQVARGELTNARHQLELAVDTYDPERYHARATAEYGGHQHPPALAYLGRALGRLGYPDQAVRRGEQALDEARRWSSPLGVAQVLGMLAMTHQGRGDLDAMWEASDRALAYAKDKGIAHWVAHGTILLAYARGITTPAAREGAIVDIRAGLDRYRRTETIFGLSEYLTLLAEVYAADQRVTEALATLDEAERHADATGERYFVADILHMRSMVIAMGDTPEAASEAETCLRRAVDEARARDTKTSELRAATSLCALLRRRGAHDEAHAVLAPVYGWFTEGFDTAILRAAQTALGAPSDGRATIRRHAGT